MGFERVDSSEMLANPDDDRSVASFPERWNVDRFLLKFRKPARSGTRRRRGSGSFEGR